MKNFWKKHKIKIISAVYVTLVVVTVRFGVAPFANRLNERADDIQKRILDNQINRDRMGEIPSLEEELDEYQEKKNALNVVVDSNEEIYFIKKLESISEETGNKISLNIEDEKLENKKAVAQKEDEKSIRSDLKYDSYTIMTITLNGDYRGLVNFIRKLENADQYVNILSISSEKADENEISGPKASFGVDVFSAPSNPNESESDQSKVRKEILESKINIAVYNGNKL
jgi:F0F1-type ATP synthase membrane subunit b/b'